MDISIGLPKRNATHIDDDLTINIGDYTVTISPEIGHGAYGQILKAVHITSGDIRVVKKLELTNEKRQRSLLLKHARREEHILCLLSHENIVKYYGLITHRTSWWLFLQMCTLGSLKAYLINNMRLSINSRVDIKRQCAAAIMYLHEQDIMHRDIKISNILMTEYCDKHLVKVSDFGMSKLVCTDYHDDDLTKHHIGTRYYRAPEQFQLEKYTSAVDVFALGLTFLIIFEFGLQNEYLVPRSCMYMLCYP